MYSATVAEHLRSRGHDVVSVHEGEYRWLEGAPDAEIATAAIEDGRTLVTENVADYRRLEADALAGGRPIPALVFTTNRQFPRGHPATTGSLVRSLDYLLSHPPTIPGALFLRPAGGED